MAGLTPYKRRQDPLALPEETATTARILRCPGHKVPLVLLSLDPLDPLVLLSLGQKGIAATLDPLLQSPDPKATLVALVLLLQCPDPPVVRGFKGFRGSRVLLARITAQQ